MSQAETDARHRSAPSCSKHGSVNMTPARSPIAEATALVLRIGRAAMVHACEVGRMVSVAATVPYHLFGSRPDSEYIGLQPVPADTAPTARPVLLVHGLGGTKSSWSHLAKTLSARGLTFAAVTYAPFGTSVERLADRLAVDVERMLSQTGADKVHLVGHSLGGVVIAQALASGLLGRKVDTVVTLGAPFGGSPWANMLPLGALIRALREDSPLLRRLASAPAPDGVRWLSVTAALDIVVPGVRSVPPHAHAETVTVGGVGHLGMLLSDQVAGRIVAALAA
jgi:triacylglycerol lipase